MESFLKSLPIIVAVWIVLNAAIAAVLYGIGSYRRRSKREHRLFHIKALYGQHYQRKNVTRWDNTEHV